MFNTIITLKTLNLKFKRNLEHFYRDPIYIEFSDAPLYDIRIQTRYYLSKNSLKTFFDFKQAVSWNRLTMANESDYESDPVRILIDSNRCIFF